MIPSVARSRKSTAGSADAATGTTTELKALAVRTRGVPCAIGVTGAPVSTPVCFSSSPPSMGVTSPERIPAGPSVSQCWKAMRWKRWETKGPKDWGRFIGRPR